ATVRQQAAMLVDHLFPILAAKSAKLAPSATILGDAEASSSVEISSNEAVNSEVSSDEANRDLDVSCDSVCNHVSDNAKEQRPDDHQQAMASTEGGR
ncbi:MAG: hypothetical protein FWC56_04580, partial [Phycisphaerae bacterium]|nr:hypothetical protein [Phycisphaerae bacterium]